jgi:O-antigen ligase
VEKGALTIYLIILILSPLLFGAVHTYAYTFMALAVLAGSVLLVKENIQREIKTGVYQVQFPKTSLNFAFVSFLVFLVFQIIPLPAFLVTILSPEAYVTGLKSVPASGVLETKGALAQWFTLSPYRYPVRMSIIRLSMYALFFLGLTQVLNSRRRIELTILIIVLIGCFEALYGLAETYSGSGHIWWYQKAGHRQEVTGTYINRNHFAGLMEMCLLLAAAYVAALSGRKEKRNDISRHTTSLRARVAMYLSREQRFNKRLFVLFSGGVLGVGLIFSASRGGMISAAGAMLCMSLFFLPRSNHRGKGFILLLLFLIISAYSLHIGADYPVERFRYMDTDLEARSRYTQKTIEMFEDYKLMGIGVGNFQYAYPRYQAPEDKLRFFRHAHNDWAQFLSEAGIIGFCLLLAGLLYYLYRTIRLWRKRTDPFAVCLGVAPLAVMTAMAIHSYSDFNLHIPANCMMLAAIMAVGYSALCLERGRGPDSSFQQFHTVPLRYKGIVAVLTVLGCIAWNGVWVVRHFMAEASCNTVTNSTLNRDQNPPLNEIQKAIDWDRWNAEYWYKRGRELIRLRDEALGNPEADYDIVRRFQIDAVKALEEAVQLNPFAPEYHMRLGWAYMYLREGRDCDGKWLRAADIAMERTAYFAGEKNPFLHAALGNYWIYRSKTMYSGNSEWEIAWTKARWHYKTAQSVEQGKALAENIATFVWRYYPDKRFVRDVLLVENQAILESR